MNWSCEQSETHLSEYLDGLLDGATRASFEEHVGSCQRCGPLLSSVSHLLTEFHAMEELETPPHLVYSILDKTLGPREAARGWHSVLGWIRWLATPRFAYGALSLAGTFLMILTASGFSWRKPKLADLSPARIYRNADRQAHLVYAHGTKFVSDLRVVYEIQSRLPKDAEIPTNPEETLPPVAPNKEPGSSDGSKPPGSHQQNRANGVAKNFELLAEMLPLLSGTYGQGGAR